MTDVDTIAEGIVAGVGGPGNIRSIGHCTTRLRLVLADKARADKAAVRALPGIMSTVERGGQFQVVVGHEVAEVDRRVRQLVTDAGVADLADAPPPMAPADRVFDLLAGTFQPLLWPLVGASMVRTLLSLAVRFGWVETGSGTWAVWFAAGNAFFVLLPVFVGATAAHHLGANRYVGAAIGAALIEGTLLELGDPGTRTTFLGIPMSVVDYSSSVFPALLASIGLSFLERWLRRHLPKDLHLVAIPALSLAILVPATVLLFGPIGTTVGDAVAAALTALNDFSPALTGALYAAGFMFLVMFGLHWAVVPISLSALAEYGSEPLGAYMGAYNFAAFGVALGVAVRTRDLALRQLGVSGLVTGVLAGISEPTVYGILLRFRRTLAFMVVAAATGGAVLGLGRVEATASAFSNLFTIPAFQPIGGYLIGIGVSFAMGAGLVIALGYEDRPGAAAQEIGAAQENAAAQEVEAGQANMAGRDNVAGQQGVTGAPVEAGQEVRAEVDAAPKSVAIRAPLPGVVVPLAEVSDPVFARGLLGPGVAIRPSSGGLVRSPVAGRVTSVARAKHAVGLTATDGVDVMIHVGIDTVHLAGRHFEILVATGDLVTIGQPIAYADIPALLAEGYDPTTPVVITNAAAMGQVEVIAGTAVTAGDPLLEVQPHGA